MLLWYELKTNEVFFHYSGLRVLFSVLIMRARFVTSYKNIEFEIFQSNFEELRNEYLNILTNRHVINLSSIPNDHRYCILVDK